MAGSVRPGITGRWALNSRIISSKTGGNWIVYERDDIEGVDSSIIQNRNVWKYSGHEDTFSDPLVDCRDCNARLRLDKLDVRPADGKGDAS